MIDQTRLDWLNSRRKGIGASDMPAICGVSPYQTALGIYLSKVNPVEPKDENLPFDDPRRVGQIVEPTIARLYAERTGKTLRKGPAQTVHPSISWMNASLDYLHDDDGEPVDCKNVTTFDSEELAKWGDDGTDQVPHHIAIQMHQQMEVSGASRAHVAALFHGRTLKVYTIERDNQLAWDLIEIGNEFWQMVENRTPPEPDWRHPSTPAVIKRLYNRVEPRTVKLGQTELAHRLKVEEAKEQIKRLQSVIDDGEMRIKAAMGNAERAEFPDGGYATRKECFIGEVVIKPYKKMDFRMYGPKKTKSAKKKTQATTPPDINTTLDKLEEAVEQERTESDE